MKLISGMVKACEKRPIGVEEIERIADEIEQELQSSLEREVASDQIGEMVMERLKTLDVDVVVIPSRKENRTISLEEAFRTSFVISNHLPNRGDNQKVIRREHFESMRPGAVFMPCPGTFPTHFMGNCLKNTHLAQKGNVSQIESDGRFLIMFISRHREPRNSFCCP